MLIKLKKILCIALLVLVSGCSDKNTEHVVDNSNTEDTDSIEYYNNNKAPEGSVVEGLKMDAYVLDDTHEHSVQSNILNQDDTVSISFWIEPSTNEPGAFLFTLRNEDEEFVRLANLLDNGDGTYSGLNLWMCANGADEWLISHSDLSLNTFQYNQVVITFDKEYFIVYLNGEEAVNGTMSNSISAIENSTLTIGDDTIFDYLDIDGRFQDFKIVDYPMSAEEVKNEFDSFYPEVLLDKIVFSNYDDVVEEFWLFPELDDSYAASWVSDKPEFIEVSKNHGVITLPTVEEGDQDVTLTISTTVNEKNFKKDFVFTVRADSEETALYRDTQAIDINIDYILNENDPLPTSGEYNSTITWKVLSGDCILEDDILVKQSEEEKMPVSLQATLSNGEYTETLDFDVILLDEYVAYIMSYFNGELGEERGKLAYSYDGLNWTDLNDGEAIISTKLGNGRVRDPFIGRDKNGDFIVLATQGFDTPEIFIWQTPDLIDFSNNTMPLIAYYDDSIRSTGERAWAPEMVYDEKQDLYYIYYSDPMHEKGGHIYYVTTTDFYNFSFPGAFYAPGYSVIDGTVVNMDGKYWMFYKDERVGATTIFYASTNQLSNLFGLAYDEEFIFHKKFIEGPFVVDDIHSNDYYLYVDNYPNARFYVARFSQLGSDPDFEWLDESEYSLPNEDVRHGSTIDVTQKELDKILEAYN